MDKRFIWRPYDDGTSPLTAEMIQEAEGLSGVKLPERYLEMMRQQDGGIRQVHVHSERRPCT